MASLTRQVSPDNNAMHAKPDLRVVLKWMIAGSGSVIADVIPLLNEMFFGDFYMAELSSNQFPPFQIYERDGIFRIEGIAGTFDAGESAEAFLVKYKAAEDIEVEEPGDKNTSLTINLRLVEGAYYSETSGRFLKSGSTYYWSEPGQSLKSCLREHEETPYLTQYVDTPKLDPDSENPQHQ